MAVVTVTGLAKEDLSDVSAADFLEKAEAAGVLDGMRLADRPCILDYDDADPTGANSSHAAFAAMAADCATDGVTAVITPGIYVLDGASSITLRNGAGFSGVPGSGATNGYETGRRGVFFQVPYSGNRMVPPIAVQRGALLENAMFHYPDVVARLRSGAYSIDASSYPVVTGGPEAYAPAIVSQHRKHDDGSSSAGGENCGGVVLRNIGMVGAYDGIFLGDADPEVETWAANYASLHAKGVPGITIDGFYGYVLRRNLVVERSNNIVACRNWLFTPAMWTEAGQMGVTGIDPVTHLDPHGWPDANPSPLIRWAQQNNTMITLRRKALASFDNVAGRCGRHVIRCEAGAAMPNPATGAFDETGTTNGYFAGPAGQDNGKFRFKGRNMAFERYPTLLRMEPTAYTHRSVLQATGHFMDHDDPDCVAPVIDIATDKTMAGSIQKRNTDNNDAGDFKAMANYTGFANFFDLAIQEAAGAIIQTTAQDGHTHYTVTGSLMGRWGQGDRQEIAAFMMGATLNTLYHSGSVMSAADNASSRVYDMAEVNKLFPVNNSYYLEHEESVVVDHEDFAGFVGCNVFEVMADIDEEGEDADGGSGELFGDGEL